MAITVSDNMAKILEKLGLMDTDIKLRSKITKQLEEKKNGNLDLIYDLKTKVQSIEKIILKKKKEMDNSKGISKTIVKNEIVRLFSEIDGIQQEERLISSNIMKIDTSLQKYRVINIIENYSLDEYELEDLAFELEGAQDEHEATEKAFTYLNKIEVEKSDDISIDKRLDELEENSKVSDEELPEDLLNRIKEIEEG